jgi:hypothetical protein
MSALEIMHQIRQLPADEVFALGRMVHDMENELWDRQMEADVASGALDFLFDEAEAERVQGTLKPWPSPR